MNIPKPVKKVKPTVYELIKTRKKRKKSPRQTLIKACDELWSQCVIKRDLTCRWSGEDTYLSAHHIRSRGHWATRWQIDNGLTLSWRKVHFLQKANPERFQDIVIDVIGDETYQDLKRQSLVVIDLTIADLQDRKEYLQKELAKFKSGDYL